MTTVSTGGIPRTLVASQRGRLLASKGAEQAGQDGLMSHCSMDAILSSHRAVTWPRELAPPEGTAGPSLVSASFPTSPPVLAASSEASRWRAVSPPVLPSSCGAQQCVGIPVTDSRNREQRDGGRFHRRPVYFREVAVSSDAFRPLRRRVWLLSHTGNES